MYPGIKVHLGIESVTSSTREDNLTIDAMRHIDNYNFLMHTGINAHVGIESVTIEGIQNLAWAPKLQKIRFPMKKNAWTLPPSVGQK